MPGPRLTLALAIAGALGCVSSIVGAVALAGDSAAAALFTLTFVAAYGAGLVAWRAVPDNLAARRLLAFGATALVWTGVSLPLALAWDANGDGGWYVLPNLVATTLDLLVGAWLLALLAVYPDGRYQRPYERVLVRAAFVLAAAVPPLLLLAGERVQPSLVATWLEDALGLPDVASPVHVDALVWMREPLSGYAEGVLALLPLLAAGVAVARYRRFPRAERVQLVWLLYGALLFAATAVTDFVLPAPLADAIEIAVLLLVPALFAIGIVRPGLVDIERVLRRSALFGVLWALIAVAYLGAAAALGIAAGSGSVQVAVVVAIAATLLFQPVWRALVQAATRSVWGEAAALSKRAAELAASRERLVEAEERGRRRLERDIHDGVQQELVALLARIELARLQLARDPSLVDATLTDLHSEARQALADLRDLASGIHPSVLSDRGILEAIESRAARLPIGVTIEADPGLRDTRFSETAEGAVFFTVSEALTNVLKHSGAERAVVVLTREPGDVLRVEVRDDGHGFDAAAPAHGSGLGGLADRIDALGGTLEIESGAAGTRLVARLPAVERARV